MAHSNSLGPRKGSRYHRLDDIPTNTFTPRTYQIELLDAALRRNTLLCLGCAQGKVFLALMVAKEMASVTRLSLEDGGKRTFYLTDSEEEADSLYQMLPHHTDLPIGKFAKSLYQSEDRNASCENERSFQSSVQNIMESCSIVVCHGPAFLAAVTSGTIDFNTINLLIFDDCHCSVEEEDHPYSLIVSALVKLPKEYQPHILGLTASIAGTESSDPQELQETVALMESRMNAYAETSMLILSERFGCRPKEFVVRCEQTEEMQVSLTEDLQTILEENLYFFTECSIAIDNEVDNRDPNQIPIQVLSECLNIVHVLGSWCTSSIAEYFIMQLDKIVKCEKNDIHKKFLRCVITTLRGLTRFFEINFRPNYDVEELLEYATPKVRELVKVLRNYKPEVDFMIISNDGMFDNDDLSDLSDEDDDDDSIMSGSEEDENCTPAKSTHSPSKPVHIAVKRTSDGGHERIVNFSEEDEKNLCGLVFVENRYIAFGLNKIIEEVCSWDENLCFVKSSHITGQGLRGAQSKQKGNRSFKRQKETLRKFRMQERNLIITTPELEEGIDIPKCNLVVRFDPPKDYRSYTLSKGRARARDATYVILLDEDHFETFSSSLDIFKGIEQVLLGENRSKGNPQESEDEDDEGEDDVDIEEEEFLPPYLTVPGSLTSAQVSMQSAIGLINRYCAKLPSDAFTHLTPHCRLECLSKDPPHYVAYLRLPINSPVKQELKGPVMKSQRLAKMAVSLKMCEILHKKGELDENLVPVGKEMFLYEEEEEWADEEDQAGQARPGTTKRKQYYIKKAASALVQCRPKPREECFLYLINLRLTGPITDEQNTRGRVIYAPEDTVQTIGILLSKEIPEMPHFPVYTRSGEVTASVDLLKNDLVLTEEEISRLLKFHHFVFSGVLHLEKDPMEFSAEKAECGCIIVPLNGNSSDRLDIEWSFVDKVIKFMGMEKRASFCSKANKEDFHFSVEEFKDAVVMPSYRNIDQPQHFYVAEIRHDLNPLSPFPSPELYKTFRDYYTTKYGLAITNTSQPLLDVDHTSARLNLLTPRYMNQKGVALPTSSAETKRARRENLQQKQILVPELCDVHVFPASLWRKTVCLPAILYRTNCLLLAEELRRKISHETGIGVENLPDGFRFPQLDFGFETSPEKLKEADVNGDSSSAEANSEKAIEKAEVSSDGKCVDSFGSRTDNGEGSPTESLIKHSSSVDSLHDEVKEEKTFHMSQVFEKSLLDKELVPSCDVKFHHDKDYSSASDSDSGIVSSGSDSNIGSCSKCATLLTLEPEAASQKVDIDANVDASKLSSMTNGLVNNMKPNLPSGNLWCSCSNTSVQYGCNVITIGSSMPIPNPRDIVNHQCNTVSPLEANLSTTFLCSNTRHYQDNSSSSSTSSTSSVILNDDSIATIFATTTTANSGAATDAICSTSSIHASPTSSTSAVNHCLHRFPFMHPDINCDLAQKGSDALCGSGEEHCTNLTPDGAKTNIINDEMPCTISCLAQPMSNSSVFSPKSLLSESDASDQKSSVLLAVEHMSKITEQIKECNISESSSPLSSSSKVSSSENEITVISNIPVGKVSSNAAREEAGEGKTLGKRPHLTSIPTSQGCETQDKSPSPAIALITEQHLSQDGHQYNCDKRHAVPPSMSSSLEERSSKDSCHCSNRQGEEYEFLNRNPTLGPSKEKKEIEVQVNTDNIQPLILETDSSKHIQNHLLNAKTLSPTIETKLKSQASFISQTKLGDLCVKETCNDENTSHEKCGETFLSGSAHQQNLFLSSQRPLSGCADRSSEASIVMNSLSQELSGLSVDLIAPDADTGNYTFHSTDTHGGSREDTCQPQPFIFQTGGDRREFDSITNQKSSKNANCDLSNWNGNLSNHEVTEELVESSFSRDVKADNIIKFSFSTKDVDEESRDLNISHWNSGEEEEKHNTTPPTHDSSPPSTVIESEKSARKEVSSGFKEGASTSPVQSSNTPSDVKMGTQHFDIGVWNRRNGCMEEESLNGNGSLNSIRLSSQNRNSVHDVDHTKNQDSSISLDEDRDLKTFVGPSPCLILQALTMSNANDFFSLERLETIGDSFLKYAITVYLYCSYPGIHEGKLSYLRSKQVSNYNLYRLGRRKALAECMVSTKFEPYENWLPPGFIINEERRRGPVPKVVIATPGSRATNSNRNFYLDESCEAAKHRDETVLFHKELEWIQQSQEADQQDDLDDPGVTATPYSLQRHHGLPDKSVADCVEALIGCYLTTCGRKAALMFMSWLGLKVLPKKVLHEEHEGDCKSWQQVSEQEFDELRCPPSPMFSPCPASQAQLDHLLEGFHHLEEKICYRFRDRSYLLQAFTHASYHYNTITDCYQRVEFLGDAILDYVITRHLYEDSQKYSPGILTDLRSALVNNNIFAALAVKWGFHKYFKAISPSLFAVIDKFVTRQKEKNQDDIDIDEEYQELNLEEGEVEEATEDDDEEEEVEMEIPKALGDIFESVAGAIYLDSGMSLDIVWKVYYRMMKPHIDKYLKSIPKSPVRELLETEPETAKFERPERTINGKIRVTVNVVGKGVFSGVGRNYRIAKSAAAKKALRSIRSLNQNLLS